MTTTPTITDRRFRSPFIFLGCAWVLAGVSILMPFADSVFVKALLLLTPVSLSLLAPLLDARAGFALWSITVGFLVSQTGFQVDVAGMRTSVLELVLLLLLPLLIWSWRSSALRFINLRVPGQRWFALFVLYSGIMLLVGLQRGAYVQQALQVLKGFVVYPILIYIVVAGVYHRSLLRLAVVVALGSFSFFAVLGLLEFAANPPDPQATEIYRASADFASINTFGVTFAAVALFAFGIGLSLPKRWQQLMMIGYACILFLAAATSVARTVWLVFAVGLVYLLLAGKQRSIYPLLILVLGGVLLFSISNPITERVLQLTDSSTMKRSAYLASGIAGFSANWLTGWGWGITYWMPYPGVGAAVPGIPWYHNEYLNLGVQTGIVGVGLYLGFWLSILRYGHVWLSASADPMYLGYVRGSMAALIGLFVAAATEHVWWKVDIAGLGVWFAGLMLVAIRLSTSSSPEPSTSIARARSR